MARAHRRRMRRDALTFIGCRTTWRIARANLKWVQLLSAGADHAMAEPCRPTAITMTTASGIHATPIAEYTIASMLAYAHRFHLIGSGAAAPRMDGRIGISGTVEELERQNPGRHRIHGSIGRETARLAQARSGCESSRSSAIPAHRRDDGWCPRAAGRSGGCRFPTSGLGPDHRVRSCWQVNRTTSPLRCRGPRRCAEIHRPAGDRCDAARRVHREHRARRG